jgi:glucans biosynthesis protein
VEIMTDITRRNAVASLVSAGVAAMAPGASLAQMPPQGSGGSMGAPAGNPTPGAQRPRFSMEDVVKRARELAAAPFAKDAPLPEALERLDFDTWRDIRFRADKAFFGNRPFRLQTMHLGHLYKRPVVVNTVRDGIATPIPYAANMFDYGRSKFDKPLPINLGFAGFRLHYPLNDPKVFDELISFVGASYFRVLGRGQKYGLSARALTVNAGTNAEEFPFFREFWIETPEAAADHATIYGLLDGASVTGAFRFDVFPGVESVIEVSATIVPRRADVRIGLAPLTSMYFNGETDLRKPLDFRRELHDSDGVLMHTGGGEWLWRPLRNPNTMEISSFLDSNPRGFGLMQRDRTFEHYQDLDLNYEARPSYWLEPRGEWGEGRVELIELPTTDETNDNIVSLWAPAAPLEAGKPFSYAYRLTSTMNGVHHSPAGRAVNTYQTQARAYGSNEPVVAGTRRFIIDFAGGDLAFHLNDPAAIEIVPSASNGAAITRSFVVPNPYIKGFRAAFDVKAEPGKVIDLRAWLRAGGRPLTETWTYPWKAE